LETHLTHLAGPGLTTTKYNSKGKKPANTAAKREADAKHAAWLKRQGLHPDQRDMARAVKGKHTNPMPNLKVDNSTPLGNNLYVDGARRTGVMANLHRESPEIQAAIIDKANRVDVGYNKGGLIYVTPGTDPTTLGSKSRR